MAGEIRQKAVFKHGFLPPNNIVMGRLPIKNKCGVLFGFSIFVYIISSFGNVPVANSLQGIPFVLWCR